MKTRSYLFPGSLLAVTLLLSNSAFAGERMTSRGRLIHSEAGSLLTGSVLFVLLLFFLWVLRLVKKQRRGIAGSQEAGRMWLIRDIGPEAEPAYHHWFMFKNARRQEKKDGVRKVKVLVIGTIAFLTLPYSSPPAAIAGKGLLAMPGTRMRQPLRFRSGDLSLQCSDQRAPLMSILSPQIFNS